MTTSLDDIRKLISEELSKTVNAGQGVYVLVPHNNLVSGSNSRLHRRSRRVEYTIHGFRSTASTVLNEAQFNRDWIELQLAHNDGTIRGVYNAAEWLPGRRKMMAWWADFLEGKASPPQE